MDAITLLYYNEGTEMVRIYSKRTQIQIQRHSSEDSAAFNSYQGMMPLFGIVESIICSLKLQAMASLVLCSQVTHGGSILRFFFLGGGRAGAGGIDGKTHNCQSRIQIYPLHLILPPSSLPGMRLLVDIYTLVHTLVLLIREHLRVEK